MSFLSRIFGGGGSESLKSAIDQGAFLVDVRTPGEFAGGHVKGSVNIPLDRIASQIQSFRNKGTVVVFCQSGMRSAQAQSLLKSMGIADVINGGSWSRVRELVG